MVNGQSTIFEMLYETYKIKKPIRLIEFFSGYGSQALALKYLGIKFEHWKICEWAIKSIQAYKDIHFTDSDVELNSDRTREDMINFLFQKGISSNYNEPMKKELISRFNNKTLKKIIKNIAITNNLVNIQQVKGIDLCITDTDKFTYLLTYSFPCQDLSLAGKGKGMSDTSTRSGMLWEVERILVECNELGNLPEILLMENVPQVHGIDNIEDFNKWQLKLEQLGYKNYVQDLIATDYGIPQTRNRCFMVSILGDYNYTFPKPIPLKLKLKDMLEDNVSDKYFLSEKMLNCFLKESQGGYPRKERFYQSLNRVNDNNISNTITTLEGNRDISTFIKIKNATKKGYLEATDGDGVDISSRMEYHRGTVQKGKTQTITTAGGENNGVCVLGNYMKSNYNASRVVDKEFSAPTVMENHGTITATQTTDLRIRKLTPRECFRLMGVKDKDFDNVSKNQSDSSLYHLAGDSIVVNVLMAIFKEMIIDN